MNNKQKILYLVRHAKSSWDEAALTDRERPLSERGRLSATEMGTRMREQGYKPDLILSSPAKRAFSTAKSLAKELAYDRSDIVRHEKLYFSGAGGMISVLEGVDDSYQNVMMVGHNPAMTSLMNILVDTSTLNMPTCAIAVISFDIASWAELDTVDGELLGYDYPKGSGTFTE